MQVSASMRGIEVTPAPCFCIVPCKREPQNPETPSPKPKALIPEPKHRVLVVESIPIHAACVCIYIYSFFVPYVFIFMYLFNCLFVRLYIKYGQHISIYIYILSLTCMTLVSEHQS